MTSYFGIPGPGGSLGKCAVCGNSFVVETILGRSVKSFTAKGIEQTMFAHDKCITVLKDCGDDWTKLPTGPLREVFEANNSLAAEAKGRE